MHPITGVFNETWASNPVGPDLVIESFGSRSWYRQKKPYNLPLPYQAQRGVSRVRFIPRDEPKYGFSRSYNSFWRPYVASDSTGGDPHLPFFSSLKDQALQKALSRFNSRRGEKASLGVTLAEMSQATQMIERRARQTLQLVNALRRFRFGDAARLLGVSPTTVRKKSRELSGLQLEISFGWMPFIGDMYKTLEVLNAPIPYGITKGTATINGDLIVVDAFGSATHKVKVRAYVAAVLEVERPALDLASRLGLTNLPIIAFELIPFSFVGNWVINFEEYLSQFEDYPGVKVINPHYGFKVFDDFAMTRKTSTGVPEYEGDGFGVSFHRTVGSLPSTKLGIRPSMSLGFRRALNAISLLVQKGIRGR